MDKRDIVQILAKDSLLTEDETKRSFEILNSQSEESSPWFVQLLTGAGAWLAAVMFAIFFGFTGIIKDETGAIIVGFILVAIAFLISVRSKQAIPVFPDQLLLATSLTGHVLLMVGFYSEFNDQHYIAAVVIVLLSLCFILFYKNQLHKFISTWLLLAGLWVLAAELGIQPLAFMALLVIVVAALSAWMWMNESHYLSGRWKNIGRPVQYAFVFALLSGEGIIERFYSIFWYSRDWNQHGEILTSFPYTRVVSAGLFLVLAYVIILIMNRLKIDWKSLTGAGFLIFALIITIVFYQSPSIMAALIVLLIGIERANRILVPLAIMALVYFYGDYYYSIDMTLMKKSLILMSSGLIMLAGGWLVRRVGQVGERS